MSSFTVIYDEKCPFCTLISDIVDVSSKFQKIPYQSDEAQKMLEEELDDPGFAFFLFEDDKIFYGNQASKRVAEVLFRSRLLGGLFYTLYPILSRVFTFLSRRPEIQNPKCESDRCIVQKTEGGIIERKD